MDSRHLGGSGLPPIPGTLIDPQPKPVAASLVKADEKGIVASSAYRAFLRFNQSQTTLLAAGTTYYAFLSVFAIVVAAVGFAALIGGQRLVTAINASVSEAFPGIFGEQGISATTLESVGKTTSALGLAVLLVSGAGAMVAVSRAIHIIYGAPRDPRNFVLARVRLLGWLLLLVPLMALSFLPSGIISMASHPVLDALGVHSSVSTVLLFVAAGVVSLLLNALVIWLILGHLGGIRPARDARLAGTVLGAIGIELLKYLLSFIINWSIHRPQYAAFAAPIAMMFVLYLESLVLYTAAALTAAVASAVKSARDPSAIASR